MKGRDLLLALPALVLALGCENPQQPNGLKVPSAPSKVLSDGAHGGNPDFFFLPPLVKLNRHAPGFELGTFNNSLQPRLIIKICELDANSTPTDETECVSGPLVKRFDGSEINLVNLPSDREDIPKPFHHGDWWEGSHRPADGFYYALWNTRDADLNLEKFYRITVLLKGSGTDSDFLLGFADVDPKAKGGPKWKYSRTRDLIEMIDGVLLPIPFRVENVGGRCSRADNCIQKTVTNEAEDGTGFQFVQVDRGGGAIAGARFPDGWLPAGGPQSVVVTISEVPSDEDQYRARTTPCHIGLPLQQFNKCFRFTTTPVLATDRSGNQFAEFVTVAVCYTLQDSEDGREHFAEIWASGPNERTRPLPDVSDFGILGQSSRGCITNEGLGPQNANPLTQFASSGWRVFKGGLTALFGVRTAYAVDLGLGGIVKNFSNFGAAVSASIEAYPNSAGQTHFLTLDEGGTATATVRILGNHSHSGVPAPDGINDVPVTFTVSENDGGFSNGEGLDLEATRITSPIFVGEGEQRVDGIASVQWTPPTAPGTYRMTASGPTLNGPVRFAVIVR